MERKHITDLEEYKLKSSRYDSETKLSIEELFKLRYDDMLNKSYNEEEIEEILKNHLKEYIEYHGMPTQKEYIFLVNKLAQFKLLNSFIWFFDNVNTPYKKYHYSYVPFYLYGYKKARYSEELSDFDYEKNTEEDLIKLFSEDDVYSNAGWLYPFYISIKLGYVNLIKTLFEINRISSNSIDPYILIYYGILQSINYNNINLLKYFLSLPFNYTKLNIKPVHSEIDDMMKGQIYEYGDEKIVLNVGIPQLIYYLISHEDNLNKLDKRKIILDYIFKHTILLNDDEKNNIMNIFNYQIANLFNNSIKEQPIFAEPYFELNEPYQVESINPVKKSSQDSLCDIYLNIKNYKNRYNVKINIDVKTNIDITNLYYYLKNTKVYFNNNLLYITQEFENKIYITSLERVIRFYEFSNGRFANITLYPTTNNQELNRIIVGYHS